MKNKYNREIFLKSKVEINKFNISISTDQIKKKTTKKSIYNYQYQSGVFSDTNQFSDPL